MPKRPMILRSLLSVATHPIYLSLIFSCAGVREGEAAIESKVEKERLESNSEKESSG